MVLWDVFKVLGGVERHWASIPYYHVRCDITA
jgi:hypothetical protein